MTPTLGWPHREARTIAVHDFSVTYLWPLRLEADGGLKELREDQDKNAGAWLDEYSNWIANDKSQWSVVDDYYTDPDRGLSDAARYAEFLYFHPYIHRILFEKRAKCACRILRRKDITGVRIQLRANSASESKRPQRLAWTCQVEEITLFLFPTDIAIAAVRISNPRAETADSPEVTDQASSSDPIWLPSTRAFSLADALDFLEYVRRVYPPFWFTNKEKILVGGLVPISFDWLGTGTYDDPKVMSFADPGAFHLDVRDGRKTPVARHWKTLLHPLIPDDGKDRDKSKLPALFYSQVEDDRLPMLAYLCVDEPAQISEGDWYRLAFCDDQGSSAAYPFAKQFLRRNCADVFYDRYWDLPVKATRYACVGYAFTVVVRERDRRESPPIREHMAQHYLVLALLAHLQKASLLAYWKRLSDMVNKFASEEAIPESRTKLYRAQQWLLQDLTDFVSRFYFIEVSNQLQAHELFNLWRTQLGIERLYEEVTAQSRFVAEVVETRTQGEISEAQAEMARRQGVMAEAQVKMAGEQTRLANIANTFLPPALAAAVAQALSPEVPNSILCWLRTWAWAEVATPSSSKLVLFLGLWLVAGLLWKFIPALSGWIVDRWHRSRG